MLWEPFRLERRRLRGPTHDGPSGEGLDYCAVRERAAYRRQRDVEAVQTYQRHGEQHTCVIVEFEGDKIARETRYYAPSFTPPERG